MAATQKEKATHWGSQLPLRCEDKLPQGLQHCSRPGYLRSARGFSYSITMTIPQLIPRRNRRTPIWAFRCGSEQLARAYLSWV